MSTTELHQRALDRLAELRAQEQRATLGPWWAGTTGAENGDHWHVLSSATMTNVAQIRSDDGEDESLRRADAVLIATMRNAWPAVLAGIEARLDEHAPHHEQRGTRACPRCLLDYPCPTISADLAVLGIDPEGEPDE